MQKEILIPVYLLGCAIVFGIISFLLYLTGGKNRKLLTQKLRLGALIITMTAALGCSSGTTDSSQPLVTCYKPAPPDFFTITQEHWKESGIVVDESFDYTLTCIVGRRTSENYSFKLVDSNNKTFASGNLQAEDGKFDEDSEDVKVKFDKNIPKGEYSIQFYNVALDDIKDGETYSTSMYNISFK